MSESEAAVADVKKVKLDLGSGKRPMEGFDGVDIADIPEIKYPGVNLMHFPWPFADESVDEIHSSHWIEHIYQVFFTPNPQFPVGREMTVVQEGPHSKAMFMKVFSEMWRILKTGGIARIVCPHGHANGALQDPTHVRFIVEESFNYVDAKWRKAIGIDHAAYDVPCHFPIEKQMRKCNGSPEQIHDLSLMPEETQHQTVRKWNNMVQDFDVVLVKAPWPELPSETPGA